MGSGWCHKGAYFYVKQGIAELVFGQMVQLEEIRPVYLKRLELSLPVHFPYINFSSSVIELVDSDCEEVRRRSVIFVGEIISYADG